MQYKDMNELVRRSSSTRRYFLSLPVEMQLSLQAHSGEIRTAAELRRMVGVMENFQYHCALAGEMHMRNCVL